MKTEAILGAVYTALTDDAGVSAFFVSVGVEHPQDTDAADMSVFPYCTINASTSAPFDDKGTTGETVSIQVTPWGRGTTSKSATAQIAEAADLIYTALNRATLTATGTNIINCLYESSPGIIDDPDGFTKYRPMMFRITYQLT